MRVRGKSPWKQQIDLIHEDAQKELQEEEHSIRSVYADLVLESILKMKSSTDQNMVYCCLHKFPDEDLSLAWDNITLYINFQSNIKKSNDIQK